MILFYWKLRFSVFLFSKRLEWRTNFYLLKYPVTSRKRIFVGLPIYSLEKLVLAFTFLFVFFKKRQYIILVKFQRISVILETFMMTWRWNLMPALYLKGQTNLMFSFFLLAFQRYTWGIDDSLYYTIFCHSLESILVVCEIPETKKWPKSFNDPLM